MQHDTGRAYLPFGGALLLRRRKARLTQRALGRAVGVDGSTIARWERKAAALDDPGLLRKLAAALDTEVEDLLTGAVDLQSPAGARGESAAEGGERSEAEVYEALREFPRLRSLLTSGWRHLSYERKVSVVNYLEYQVEIARRKRRRQDPTGEGGEDPRVSDADRISE